MSWNKPGVHPVSYGKPALEGFTNLSQYAATLTHKIVAQLAEEDHAVAEIDPCGVGLDFDFVLCNGVFEWHLGEREVL
jgi:hypothetical protein